jgi:hypothetical protein
MRALKNLYPPLGENSVLPSRSITSKNTVVRTLCVCMVMLLSASIGNAYGQWVSVGDSTDDDYVYANTDTFLLIRHDSLITCRCAFVSKYRFDIEPDLNFLILACDINEISTQRIWLHKIGGRTNMAGLEALATQWLAKRDPNKIPALDETESLYIDTTTVVVTTAADRSTVQTLINIYGSPVRNAPVSFTLCHQVFYPDTAKSVERMLVLRKDRWEERKFESTNVQCILSKEAIKRRRTVPRETMKVERVIEPMPNEHPELWGNQ